MATRACKLFVGRLSQPCSRPRHLTPSMPICRYMGKGVTKAVENINKHIGPALVVRPPPACKHQAGPVGRV
jgi:hypothetical protein